MIRVQRRQNSNIWIWRRTGKFEKRSRPILKLAILFFKFPPSVDPIGALPHNNCRCAFSARVIDAFVADPANRGLGQGRVPCKQGPPSPTPHKFFFLRDRVGTKRWTTNSRRTPQNFFFYLNFSKMCQQDCPIASTPIGKKKNVNQIQTRLNKYLAMPQVPQKGSTRSFSLASFYFLPYGRRADALMTQSHCRSKASNARPMQIRLESL